jgi:hypothetical protein
MYSLMKPKKTKQKSPLKAQPTSDNSNRLLRVSIGSEITSIQGGIGGFPTLLRLPTLEEAEVKWHH